MRGTPEPTPVEGQQHCETTAPGRGDAPHHEVERLRMATVVDPDTLPVVGWEPKPEQQLGPAKHVLGQWISGGVLPLDALRHSQALRRRTCN